MKESDPASAKVLRGATMLHRWITGLFGGVLVAAAIAIWFVADVTSRVGAMVGFVLILGLGLEAVFAALRNRRSLIERIGPLP